MQRFHRYMDNLSWKIHCLLHGHNYIELAKNEGIQILICKDCGHIKKGEHK